MKKIYILLILSFFLLPISRADESKIHDDLKIKINQTSPLQKIPVYIIFDNHLNLKDFDDIGYDTPKRERRRIVIERLQNFSDAYQSEVRAFLESKKWQNAIDGYEIIWMNNIIALKATTDLINSLASDFSKVQMICYDAEYPIEQLYDSKQSSLSSIWGAAEPNAVEIGCALMNADDCWLLGNKGKGVLVANADDGFWWKHPDLVKGVYQNLGEDANNNGMTIIWGSGTTSVFDPGDINGVDNDGNGKVDDLVGWDYTTNNYNITTASHGSATLGHVIGDGTGGTQTGVAPEAKCLLLRNGSGQSAANGSISICIPDGS